jgi:hypothetical protein
MSDSTRIEKTITHYNASKVLLGFLLVVANIATISILIYSTLLLVDCTTPKGECAKRQAEQTNVVLDRIARHDEASTFCANRPENTTLLKMRECIKKELSK